MCQVTCGSPLVTSRVEVASDLAALAEGALPDNLGFCGRSPLFAVSRSPSAKVEYPTHAPRLLGAVVACRIAQIL